MKLRKQLLFETFGFVIFVAFLFFSACSREELKEQVMEANEFIITQYFPGVSLVESAEYGNYLSFKSPEKLDSILQMLELRNDESYLEDWENRIGFYSMRRFQIENSPNSENWYPSDEFATFLNPEGYIMIDNVLYQDTQNGEMVYVFNDYGKSIYYDISEDIQSRNSCYRNDDTDYGYDYCSPGGIAKLKVKGKIEHYTYWVSKNERLYLKTWLYWQNCNGSGGFSYAYGTLTFDYEYNIEVDGDQSSGNGSYVRPNDNYHRIILEKGNDICINYVDSQHTGSWNLGEATANPYVID